MSSPIHNVQFVALPVDHKKLERRIGLLMWRDGDVGRARRRCAIEWAYRDWDLV